jgi:uncharacterized repeat protein (TIGR01451 family)
LNGDKLADLVALDPPNNNVVVFLNDSPTSGADLGIIRTGASPEPVGVGTNLTYSADLLNEGPKDATGVIFTDTLAGGVNFASATASQGSCIQSKGIVSCAIGSLTSAFDATVTIVVTPTAAGTITNSMSVAGIEPDLASANDTATQNSTVAPVYTLTVTKSGNGSGTITSDQGLGGAINCGTTCSTTYLSGATANLGFNPGSGSLLQSWGGVCSGTPTNLGCSITMDGDKTVTVTFVLGVTLNVAVAGQGTGTVTWSDGSVSCVSGSCSSLNLPGTSLSLTATASAGSLFGGWNGACTGTNPNVCSVTLNSDQSVTATFNLMPDFTVSPALTNLTVARGSQVSEQLSFAGQGGFSGTIALVCAVTGTAPRPTCSISPNSVSAGSTATLTVNAAGLSAALIPQPHSQFSNFYAALLPFGAFGLVFASRFDKRRRRMWFLCLAVTAAALLPAACGSGSSTPPTMNFTVMVTATSGATTHSTAISVTVQ